MHDHYAPRGLELNAARLRMATLPTPCEVESAIARPFKSHLSMSKASICCVCCTQTACGCT